MRERNTNLSAHPTRFIGRDSDLARLRDAFARGERLVTVLGPGGMGKTRLGLRYAQVHLEEVAPAGGVWIGDVSTAHDVDGICGAVGRPLGVALTTGPRSSDAVDQLGHALSVRGRTLMVIDNFEHVAAHAAATLGRWLERAPEAAFLVTSRQRLHLPGEVVWELGPLALPAADSDVGASEAVQLFVDRARAVRSTYELTAAESPHVAAIVEQLDGIPLAIELAAARTAVLSASQLLERLPRRFELLARARRDADARQSTLKTAIDWSWNLLAPNEQAALMQCSVFDGGFTIEAAEAVLDLSAFAGAPRGPSSFGPRAEAPGSVDLIQSLRDKSLVRAFALAEAPADLRLGLYGSIRAYAAEKLDASGDGDAARRRHADHYLRVAAAWSEGAAGPAAAEPLRHLALEQDNLLAVVHHSLARSPAASEDVERALTALSLIEPLMVLRGPLGSYQRRLTEALQAAGAEKASARLRARALQARGAARLARGQTRESLADFAEALDIAHAEGDRLAEARTRMRMANAHHAVGRLTDAQAHLERALPLLRDAGDRRMEAIAIAHLAQVQHWSGDTAAAIAGFECALAILRESGDERSIGITLANAADTYLAVGNLREARARYEQALDQFARLGDRRSQAVVTGNLGRVHLETGDLGAARRHIESCLATLREVGDRRREGIFLGNLSLVCGEQEEWEAARDRAERARQLFRESGDRRREATALAFLGSILAALGRPEDAADSLDRAESQSRDQGDPSLNGAVALCRGFLDLALARRADAAGDAARAEACRAAARRRAEAARASSPTLPGRPDGVPSLAEQSQEARSTLRMLERWLGQAPRPAPPAPEIPRSAFRVGREARWFQVAGGERVRLDAHRPLRLLFARLVRARREAPGSPLAVDALIAAAWPGEKVSHGAGSNRVYVALTTLRKMGLKRLIVRAEGGYLLDPEVPLVESAAEG